MKKRFSLWMLFLSGIVIFQCGGRGDSFIEIVDVPVTAQDVQIGNIEEYVSSTGTIKALTEADILTEASGFFYFELTSNVKIQEGIRVEKNQIIAKLENRELVNNARVESRLKAMQTAEREYENKKSLYEKGGITLKELQLADQNRVDAKYNYEAGLILLDKLNIRAPVSGILVKLEKITEGSFVSAGTTIGKIMDYEKVYVEISVSNTEISKIGFGQKVKVINYALPDEVFIGKVTEISRTINPESRTYIVTIPVDNPERKLRPGMFIKADVIVESKKNVVIVPRYVVLNRNNKDVVFVVEKQRAKMKEVVLGLEDKENVEILSGLGKDERIIVKGYETLKDGTKVIVSK